MPSKTKKRKISEFECEWPSFKHESKGDCNEERAQLEHWRISKAILCNTSFVLVLCGTEKTPFNVYRDLLTLHSQSCKRALDTMAGIIDQKIVLPDVSSSQFFFYLGWMHTADITERLDSGTEDDLEGLWKAGQVLEDERFQNFCMNYLRRRAKETRENDGNYSWPSSEEAQLIYRITDEGSLLRKFAADVLGRHSPLSGADAEHERWTTLLHDIPELRVDIAKAAARNWNKTQPWDDEYRASYMVDCVCIEERWDQQILAKRPRGEIEVAADGGCLMSRVQLNHLDRK